MRAMRFLNLTFLALLLASPAAMAGPFIAAGDLALRHDIQRLADYGLIKGPTSTWPLAWGPILEDLNDVNLSSLPAGITDSIVRIRARARLETRANKLAFASKIAIANNPTRIRSFQDTPRGEIEVSAGINWIDDWFALELNAQGVRSDQDSEEFRVDDSVVGVVVNNWSISVSTLDRWWGPAWDGSLILSNNARPFPVLSIDRVFTDGFNSKWLSWIGPWDLNLTFGRLEKERHVPDTQFFGMRLNFRPVASLEIGLSRTAQWCGDGRPCGGETFFDLLLGRDNRGDDGVEIENEPGNQLGGVDFRWAPNFFASSVALYGQFVGEDEAGGFPSKWLGQIGGEWSGYLFERWSTRLWGEFSATSCQFNESSELFNCAYNHSIYQTGYRYRNRSIGHGADNDARVVSVGLIMIDAEDKQWRILARVGDLNRGGAPDPANTLTPTPRNIASIDLSHSLRFRFGVLDVGVGTEKISGSASGNETTDGRFYIQWRHLF